MKNPSSRGRGGGCSGESPVRCPAVSGQHSAGGGAGGTLRGAAAPAPPVGAAGGRAVHAGSGVGLGGVQLRLLRRGYPGGVSVRNGCRCRRLGRDVRDVAAPPFSHDLAGAGSRHRADAAARQKNFSFCKNFVCIWGKMGYNKVAGISQTRIPFRRKHPWQENKRKRRR